MFQTAYLFLSVFLGVLGSPLSIEQDTSIYFDDIESRIFGGDEAGPVPYMVALTIEEHFKTFICGASLITNRHVLTAAHCIDAISNQGSLRRSARGIVGTNYWNRGGTQYTFSHKIVHPQWNRNIKKNDIGIIVTSQQVTLHKDVQTVTLNFDFIGGNIATIINGWGYFEQGNKQVSPILKELRPYTLDGNSCVSHLAQHKQVSTTTVDPSIQICTMLSKNHGICQGDSGSPLTLLNSRQQIGIASWVVLPCGIGAPDVFVRISAYKSWIQQNIRM